MTERADVLLSDGTVASIRPVSPDDEPALIALHERIGPENVRLRFFSASKVAGQLYVAHVLASPDTLALVAERRGALVGLGTAEPAEAGTAEIALVVSDECHGLGIGGLLLEHLAAASRDRGVSRFLAEVLSDNIAMLEVLRHAGFAVTHSSQVGTVQVEMDTTASYEALRAADERECLAEARSLAPVLRPGSVAVVGVRRDGTGVGATVLRSIIGGGFAGPLHVVHRAASAVQGVPAVRRLTDLAAPPDLVVVAVPAEQVLDVLRDAAAAGCPGAVVVSAGFDERGADGARMQREILDLARSSSMRVVGPNCLGVLNTHPTVRLDATFSGLVPPAGGLALASQSGGVGIVLADLARRLGIGVAMLVSLGDKVDVSGNDLLAAWRDDQHVTAAGLYLESFGNASKFARIAREFSERKPLLAVVGDRSATPVVGLRALFAQAGVVGCGSLEELAECALLLGRQPRRSGRRVGIVTNAGGLGILAADAAAGLGLSVPDRSDVGTANPANAGAAADKDAIGALADRLLGSDEVDALLVVLVDSELGDAAGAIRELPDVRRRHPDKPVLLVPLGGLEAEDLDGVATFGSAEVALRALAHAAWYDEWRREPHHPEPADDLGRAFRARATARELVASAGATSWLDAPAAQALLNEYGLGAEVDAAAGSEGVVLALRVVRDPHFGPMVLVGAGGAVAELEDDRVCLLPPYARRDAARAIRTLRVWPLLRDADVPAVEDLLVRLGRLADDVPLVAEARFDRVVVGSAGCQVRDATLRLDDRPVLDAGVPRRLRRP